jgi:hypothetical protein
MTKANYRSVPWKRNLNQIPASVKAKLAAEPGVKFVCGIVKAIPRSVLETAAFNHLGIGLVNSEIRFLARVLPPAGSGKYSSKNRDGWVVVHRDLPMVTETFYFEVPNYGDWSNGSHTISQDREVYQKDYIDPPTFEFLVELLHQSESEFVFKIVVDLPLDRNDPAFGEDLLFALNLLQENLGSADILPADARTAQLLSTLGLAWQIFPPGTADEVIRRAIGGMRNPNADQQERVRDRVAMFNALQPKHFLQGQGGLNSYVGALFADDLVVFENVRYGNALYVLFADWKDVSKRSRIDLLRARDVKFERFVHSPGWEERFEDYIRAEKRKRGLEVDEPSIFRRQGRR